MRRIKYIHPDFPNAKPFEMGIDMANVSSALNNKATWDLMMENGQKIRMESEGEERFTSSWMIVKRPR